MARHGRSRSKPVSDPVVDATLEYERMLAAYEQRRAALSPEERMREDVSLEFFGRDYPDLMEEEKQMVDSETRTRVWSRVEVLA